VIQDRQFDRDNQLVYNTTGMMDQMVGFLGDQILSMVNPNFIFPLNGVRIACD
jgi:FtsP/CotA-like multicopper oxidase with cupredoxin domain